MKKMNHMNMSHVHVRCYKCNQPLDEIILEDDIFEYKYHQNVFDCIKTLIARVDSLENELLASKLKEGLSRSSDT